MTDEAEKSAFTRPGFIASAVVIALLVVGGIFVIVFGMMKPDAKPADPGPSASEPSAAPTEETPVKGGGSVCGLDKVELSGTLDSPPAAEWSYLGTATFPTSASSGPGETAPSGMLTCFERTPAGAVFFATAATAQGSSPELAADWLEYALVESPAKSSIVAEAKSGTTGSSTEIRMTAAGFKLLEYNGDTARVDVGIRGDGKGKSIYISTIYSLSWENGDWRLDVDASGEPGQVAQLPNLAGYALWEE
ncbi:hypothetical protein JSO19_00040 [Leucobacter sp. UCMA 4100]|uniref:hypothetical protein n=1 Tax=Leucobacter sp. UCMA 4100 TaxID=2810534 RepID=UPI0022EB7D0B|nr:hypothetical protein [Leucobacter sp. UCMA 4100]MDA3145767.1 hypothetical protein [Leucobacter sp. UCMA 4100]